MLAAGVGLERRICGLLHGTGQAFGCFADVSFVFRSFVKESSMTQDAYAHQFSNWIKSRLDEMDATLTLIKKSKDALHADAKKQAEEIIARIGTRRKAFEETIRKQQPESEAAWAKAKTTLEADWASFEAAVEDYVKNSRLSAQERMAVFKARAEAQRKAWDETISALQKKAGMAAAEGKQDLDAALSHLKQQADEAKTKLEASQKAGSESWAAFKTALRESRAAFDKASQKALASPFKFIQNL